MVVERECCNANFRLGAQRGRGVENVQKALPESRAYDVSQAGVDAGVLLDRHTKGHRSRSTAHDVCPATVSGVGNSAAGSATGH